LNGVTVPVERKYKGLGVSQGIAIGPAHVRESGVVDTPEYALKKREITTEQDRLKRATRLAQRQVRRLQARARGLPGTASEELAILLDAYLHMLEDSRLVRGANRRIAEDRINAEAAVSREITEIGEAFQAMEDSYISARLDDIREVGNRILRNLGKHPVRPLTALPLGSIIVSHSLSPADMAQLDPARIAGAATMLGGGEGHTAIMARALGLPAVLGAPDLMEAIHSGDQVIVDGNAGQVVVNPTPETLSRYTRRQVDFEKENRRLSHLRRRRSISRDGTVVSLQANVELPIEMTAVKQAGAEKIGLLRSEFMFMNRDVLPTEDEQYEILSSIVKSMEGQTVTIRSLDIGAEKGSAAVTGEMDDSVTTALGLRGIRLSLAYPDMFETQFRAILRAANDGDVRVLLPMVSTVGEVRKAREIMKTAAKKLRRRKIRVPSPLPPIGVMIEVPGAALAADALAQASDFMAIGSNDLTMYTLAVDRANEHVAHLFDPLHPAVLRLIQFTAGAALRARIPVSICGEMAGDPRYTALLVGLGLRELSMTPSSIPRVKQRLREMDAVAAATRANLIMDQVDSGRIMALLDDFNALA